jgi:septal ring factor EnvC (AmiA/AmiB activator)
VNIYNVVKHQKIKRNNMKITTNQIITSVVILIIMIVGYYFWSTSKPTYIKEAQTQIDFNQIQIDSLNSELTQSDVLIDSMSNELYTLDKKNNTLKNQIINIKKQTNEKIIAVDTLNNVELEHFFTDRYDIK